MFKWVDVMMDILTRTIRVGGWVFPFSLGTLFVQFVLPVLGFFLGFKFLNWLAGRILRRTRLPGDKQQRILVFIRRISRLAFVAGTALALGTLMGAQVYTALGRFMGVLNTPFFSTGNTKISVITLLLLIPVFALASWAGKAARGMVENRIFQRIGLDEEKAFSFGRLARYLVMTLVFLFGLSLIGVDLSALGVLFGVLGIGIGFGLQGFVGDFFAGLSLIGMGIIKEGDRIRLGDYDGTIRHIRLMNTELTTLENETLIIPNSQVTQGVVHNLSYRDRRVVILNNVEVDYATDLDRALQILEEVARGNPWLENSQGIVVRVKAFNDSGIALQLRTLVKTVDSRAEALSWNNLEIWRAFREQKITIPFPQRVVHVQREPVEEEPSLQGDSSQEEASPARDGGEGLPPEDGVESFR